MNEERKTVVDINELPDIEIGPYKMKSKKKKIEKRWEIKNRDKKIILNKIMDDFYKEYTKKME